jgi:hypothetical protein
MLIGVVGFIGSGKGSVGDILIEKGFHKDSFAKPLKDAVSIIFGWPRELIEGDTGLSRAWREEPDPFWSSNFGRNFTPREALQLMGTEAGRNVFHEDIWVISLLNRSKDKNVVVTDVRFQNEIDYIQRSGGKIIRVVRGEDPVWYRTLCGISKLSEREEFMKTQNIHKSEWDWVGTTFDAIIFNDGSLSDLYDKVDFALGKSGIVL